MYASLVTRSSCLKCTAVSTALPLISAHIAVAHETGLYSEHPSKNANSTLSLLVDKDQCKTQSGA